jgi:uncharacterized protein with FMN-binding domain
MYRKFGLIVLALVLAFALPLAAQTPPHYKDGTYLAAFSDEELGKLTVSVVVKGNLISAIDLPQGKGDLDLDDATLAAYIATLVAGPSVIDVDVISGASTPCNLLKSAVLFALKDAVL